MFAYIKGILEIKTTEYVVIEVNGIGYKIFMSEIAIDELGNIGDNVKIYTYLKVKEDDISLFGFKTQEELRMFELLVSVSGVGAKIAINILANITPSKFAMAVISADIAKLKSLPGIGAKSAQRIILELQDKIDTQEAVIENRKKEKVSGVVEENTKVSEAIAALQVLGYTRKEVEEVLLDMDKSKMSVEEIIKGCLKSLSR